MIPSYKPLATNQRRWRRLDWLLACIVFLVGWAWLLGQNARVFERQADASVERFVADAVAVPFPELLPLSELVALCREPQAFGLRWWPGTTNRHVARCLADPELMDDDRAPELLKSWAADLQARIDTVERWADVYEKAYPGLRKALEVQLHKLQGPHEVGAAEENTVANSFGGEGILRTPAQGQAGAQLRKQARDTERWLGQVLADSATPATERAAKVGLMIAGKQVQRDFGLVPAGLHLNSDTGSLAESIEWRRRGQDYINDGFSLPVLFQLVKGVLLGSLVLLAVVVWVGMLATPWALISLLLGTGALLLVDLAMSADASFRYLAFRQWAGWRLPGTELVLWWPLLAIASALVLLRHARVVQSRFAQSLGRMTERFWVRLAMSERWGWTQPLFLLGVGLALLLLPGMAALKSEVIIGLGCLGLATFLAGQTALANVGGRLAPAGWLWHWLGQERAHRRQVLSKHVIRHERMRVWQLLVATGTVWIGLSVALGGSVNRGDLGHALIAAGMAFVFFVLFGGRSVRWFVAAVVGFAMALLAYIYQSGVIPGPVQTAIQALLPFHAQERFVGMVNPLTVAASDMARIRWMMDSAGSSGWGAGWVPWSGLGDVRMTDGLPLQGPSDYVPALLVAQWGAVPGALMIVLTLMLFVGGAVAAARTALAQGVSQSIRFLAGVGLFGCVLMAFKVVLSLGGVTGVLPLTGLPVSLVGYGPVSTLFGLFYLALAWGTQRQTSSTGVQMREGSALQGELVKRGRPLIWIAGGLGVLLTMASLARMNAPLFDDTVASACNLPEPDALGSMVVADQGQRPVGRFYHRNAVPHCSGSAYRLTEALVRSVDLSMPKDDQPTGGTVLAGVHAMAEPAPSAESTQPDEGTDGGVSDDAATDSEGGIVADALQAERQSESGTSSYSAMVGAVSVNVCPAMGQVVQAWNQRIAQLRGQGAAHLQAFDEQALFTQLQALGVGWGSASECRHRARELGLLLQSRLPQSLERGGRPEGGEARRFEDFFNPSASKAVARADFETLNAWRGLPGCIVPVTALSPGRSAALCTVADRAARMVAVPGTDGVAEGTIGSPRSSGQRPSSLQPVERVTLNNFWLQQQLAGRLATVKTYSDKDMQFEWRRHRLQAGPVAALTLDPFLQNLAQRTVECFTGQRRGERACGEVLPANDTHARTFFATDTSAEDNPRMRAGAMGLVLAEVDSGRVVAFANAISDCSLKALATVQPFDRNARQRPVIGDIDLGVKEAAPCSPWPDRRKGTEFLALQAPALWLVPPGSSLKPLVVLAGATHGRIKPSERDRWRSILAQSHDLGFPGLQNSIKEVAIVAAPTYRDVLQEAGFDLEPQAQRPLGRDLLWGDPAGLGDSGQPLYGSRWSVQTELIGHRVSINESFVPWRLPRGIGWAQFLAMWNDKQNGLAYTKQVQKYGPEVLGEYPFAQALANAAIGGGDIRISAMGLVDVWRSIDLRSRSRDQKSALHLLSTPGVQVPQRPLNLGTPAAAALALYASSGVTAQGGTAQRACSLVMGDCKPLRGIPALWGKTGTSDFTQANAALAKPGLDLPAKLFGGVFEVQGKRYAVAVVGLRVREGQLLDNTSAPAEAALTLLRQMQLRTKEQSPAGP